MPGDNRRVAATKTQDMKIVSSPVRDPIATPSTWRTWVLLLERPDDEAWPTAITIDRGGDRTTF
jgi:hypothetical protein